MYSGINSVPPVNAVTPVGAQPYASPQASIYFIVYMTLMTFVLLQLFIGVVIVAFQAVGVKSFRETKLDRNQVLYISILTEEGPISQRFMPHLHQLERFFVCNIIEKLSYMYLHNYVEKLFILRLNCQAGSSVCSNARVSSEVSRSPCSNPQSLDLQGCHSLCADC